MEAIGPQLQHFEGSDDDHKYMALDMIAKTLSLTKPVKTHHPMLTKFCEKIPALLENSTSDVTTQVIKCIDPLVRRLPEDLLSSLIHRICNLAVTPPSTHTSQLDFSSIPTMALTAILNALPAFTPEPINFPLAREAFSVVSHVLIPRLTVGNKPFKGQPGANDILPNPLISYNITHRRITSIIDLVPIIIRKYGPMLPEKDCKSLQLTLVLALQQPKTPLTMRNTAVVALSELFVYFPRLTAQDFITFVSTEYKRTETDRVYRKLLLSLVASMTRHNPESVEPFIPNLLQLPLAALNQDQIEFDYQDPDDVDPEVNELRIYALLTLEAWLFLCPEATLKASDHFIDLLLKIILRFLPFDPNRLRYDDLDQDEMMLLQDQDEEVVGEEEEEEEEEEDPFIDDDDSVLQLDGDIPNLDDGSSKVRTRTAVLARALILAYSEAKLRADDTLYHSLAHQLVSRLRQESAEHVLLEILAALSTLFKHTGNKLSTSVTIAAVPATAQELRTTSISDQASSSIIEEHLDILSRKRRRTASDAGNFSDHLPPGLLHNKAAAAAAAASQSLLNSKSYIALQQLSPKIITELSALLQNPTSQLPVKQLCLHTFKALLSTLQKNSPNYFEQLMPCIIQGMTKIKNTTALANSSVTHAVAQSYQVEALACLTTVLQVEFLETLSPFLADVCPPVAEAIQDPASRLAKAALSAAEHLITLLNRPNFSGQDCFGHLESIAKALVQVVKRKGSSADPDVQSPAITQLGSLLGQCSLNGTHIDSKIKKEAMELLLVRLRFETTRHAAVTANDIIFQLFQQTHDDYPAGWVDSVAIELVDQFEKSNRTLRVDSVKAMKKLTGNPVAIAQLSNNTVESTLNAVLKLINSDNLHTVTPVLPILACLITTKRKNPSSIATGPDLSLFLQPMVDMLHENSSPGTWKGYWQAIRAFGATDLADTLMNKLIDSSKNTSSSMLGKTIGELLIAGKGRVGVDMQTFVDQAYQGTDDKTKCLAIDVLGSANRILRSESLDHPEHPSFFVGFFVETDAVRQAAASALGWAGSSQVETYVPFILDSMASLREQDSKYMLVIALRELINAIDELTDVGPFAEQMWSRIVEACDDIDTDLPIVPASAECLGKLVFLDPLPFLAQLGQLILPSATKSKQMLGLLTLKVVVSTGMTLAHTEEVRAELQPLYVAVCELIPTLDMKNVPNRVKAFEIIQKIIQLRYHEITPTLFERIINALLRDTDEQDDFVTAHRMGQQWHRVYHDRPFRRMAYSCVHALVARPDMPANVLVRLHPVFISGACDKDVQILTETLLALRTMIAHHPETSQARTLMPKLVKGFSNRLVKVTDEAALNAKQLGIDREYHLAAIIRLCLDVAQVYGNTMDPKWTVWCQQLYKENPDALRDVQRGVAKQI